MIILKLRQFNSVFAFSVRTILASPQRREIKKMQNRRKSSRRRTCVRQRRFSAVEKAKTLFRLLKESARIPTSFPKSDYTKAVIKKLIFAFSICAFLASPQRGEIKSFGALDFVPQGVQAYVAVRNRAQKKRKRKILCRNPSGFRPHNQNNDYTKAPSI